MLRYFYVCKQRLRRKQRASQRLASATTGVCVCLLLLCVCCLSECLLHVAVGGEIAARLSRAESIHVQGAEVLRVPDPSAEEPESDRRRAGRGFYSRLRFADEKVLQQNFHQKLNELQGEAPPCMVGEIFNLPLVSECVDFARYLIDVSLDAGTGTAQAIVDSSSTRSKSPPAQPANCL